MTNNLDLKNKRFGKITVIEPIGKGYYGIIWKCKCDCGNETKAWASKIKQGRKKSCGCLLKGENHYLYSGSGAITGEFWARIKSHAKARNININITISEAAQLFEKQDRKCALTGWNITLPSTTKEYRQAVCTASLDRIDSSKDYTIDNVQWVHKYINLMKSNLSQDEFIKICKAVSAKCLN